MATQTLHGVVCRLVSSGNMQIGQFYVFIYIYIYITCNNLEITQLINQLKMDRSVFTQTHLSHINEYHFYQT